MKVKNSIKEFVNAFSFSFIIDLIYILIICIILFFSFLYNSSNLVKLSTNASLIGV